MLTTYGKARETICSLLVEDFGLRYGSVWVGTGREQSVDESSILLRGGRNAVAMKDMNEKL